MLEGIFFYSCIWFKLPFYHDFGDAFDDWRVMLLVCNGITVQVDGWSVQWETRREVQRGLLRADGGRSFKGLQVSLYDDDGDDEGRFIPIHHTESCRATHGITVDVPALRTAYALPVPKQRSVFSYQLVSLPPSFFGQPSDALWLWQVIHNKAEWTKWEDILNTNASLPRDVYAGNMIIPTLDTVR